MSRSARKYSTPGVPPGSLISKEAPCDDIKIILISYSQDEYEEKQVETIEECLNRVGEREVTWIRIVGTPNAELLTNIEEKFGFHPLALEDIMSSDQRPKVEDFDDYIFITVRIPHRSEDHAAVTLEQVNIFLGANFVMTIHDVGEVFDPVCHRVEENRGRVRKMGADYLAYTLIDMAIDQYFPTIEIIEDQMESIEGRLQKNPSPEIVREIRKIKRELFRIRGSVWPMREVVNSLQRDSPDLIADATRLYLRDAYDHTIQIADIIESFRDNLSEMLNLYLSLTANSTNEVMKILTIFATIFIPLTFIVGIYGMNFKFMPELKWRPAYFIVLGFMIIVALAMLRFFRKRGWL